MGGGGACGGKDAAAHDGAEAMQQFGADVATRAARDATGPVMRARRATRPGPGSFRLLAWVARLGVSGVEPARLAVGVNQATVYSHIARLARDGLIFRVAVGDGRGPVITLTRAGAREARTHSGQIVVSGRSRAPSSARHGRAVSWVAAGLELRGLQWLGPGELRAGSGWRAQRDDGTRHAPDLGLIHADGRRTAIEIELQVKSNERLALILGGYRALIAAGQLTDVSYVTDRSDVSELVRRQAAKVGVSEHVHIGPLDKIVSATRARATRGSVNASG